MNRLRLLGVALATIACASAYGAEGENSEPIVLDLQTALRLAAVGNYTVRDGALGAEVARQQLRAEQGVFDPELGMSWYRSFDADDTTEDSEVRTDDYETSVSGLLPWGASYRAGFSAENERVAYAGFADSYYSFLGVKLTQPLLRNLGTSPALAGVKLARIDAEVAQLDHEQGVNDILTSTTFAYYRLVLARGNLRVAERSIALVDKLVRDNEVRRERGAMSNQDVLEARARAARRRESLYTGRQSVVAAENTLKRLLYPDLKVVRGRSIEPLVDTVAAPDEALLAQWADSAIEARPDVRQARLAVEQRRVSLGLARSQQLPELNLVASYGYSGTGESLNDSFDQIRDRDMEAYTVGAVFSVPIPNRATRGQRRVALLQLRRAELALADFEQEVRRQLDDALADITATRQRVASTEEARVLAEQSLEAEEKRLRTGTSSTFLVLEQQEIVSEAQLRELQAQADLAMALAEFNRLAGRTVEACGLTPASFQPAAP